MIHPVELNASRYSGRPMEPQSRLVFENKVEAIETDPLLDEALCRLVRLVRSSNNPADLDALGVLLNHMDSLEEKTPKSSAGQLNRQTGIALQGVVTLTF